MKTTLPMLATGLALAAAITMLPGTAARAQDAEAAHVDVPVPDDPVALAAFEVLSTHCARCHQDGSLVDRLKPAKNFGNVLMLDQIASDPQYLVPGNPDGSKIVNQIMNKEMPYDVYYLGAFDQPEPTADDVAALRAWITQLGETQSAGCTDRGFITDEAMVASMAADLDSLQTTRVADTRYITLTHLYNACVEDEAMEVYRQATIKLLNSLSRESDVVRLNTVDAAGTIIRFNLQDIGWTPTEWDTVLAVYPYAVRPDSQMFDLLSAATLTPLPYVKGDWFAFTASQPPLYDKLLGLADSFQGLEHQLNIDTLANINAFKAKRAGFQDSGVSQNNRMIERHTIATGYFWTSYDFAGNRAEQSFFSFPLGPGDGPFAFHHDGGETIFSLPNGFQGYYLNTADGKKLDKGPTSIVRDPARRDQTVTNGISCMGCHDQGIRKAKDDVRAHVLADRTFPREVRDAVEALFPTNEEMDAVLAADANRFRSAMEAAGLTPTLNYKGVEMINALAKRYEDDVALPLGAAEFGQDQEEFTSSLHGAATAEAIRLRRRLEQGIIPRDTFEQEYIGLVEHVSDLEVIDLSFLKGQAIHVATVARPVGISRTFDLTLISDRSTYRVKDTPVFTVTSSRDCYLTLVNVDGTGKATTIFPNAFQQDNFLPARTDLDFPSASSQFDFEFLDRGTETVIATCSLQDRPVDGIQIDRTQTFTDLGNYETHVKTRAIGVKPRQTPTQATIGVKQVKLPQPTADGVVARTAIKMEVH